MDETAVQTISNKREAALFKIVTKIVIKALLNVENIIINLENSETNYRDVKGKHRNVKIHEKIKKNVACIKTEEAAEHN